MATPLIQDLDQQPRKLDKDLEDKPKKTKSAFDRAFNFTVIENEGGEKVDKSIKGVISNIWSFGFTAILGK